MILDLLMIIATGRMGEWVVGQTRDTLVCLKVKEDMKDGERAWVSGGCVPLVHASPISARTDGLITGVWAGAAGRGEDSGSGSRGLGARSLRSRLQFPVIPVSRLPS